MNAGKAGKFFNRKTCAWPTRLRIFLKRIFDVDANEIADIKVVALGGTNTETANTIWDYSLLDKDIPAPDIVIHAYATNDMHVLSEVEARNRNMTLEDRILEVNQQFIRNILSTKNFIPTDDDPSSSSPCRRPSPPLLIYYDDYIGNEQNKILQTNAFSKASQI